MREHEADDGYDEYLWGEASPHAFARRSRYGVKKKSSKALEVTVDPSVDPVSFVLR